MKFRFQPTNCQLKGRLGCITGLDRLPNHATETPTPFLYAPQGVVPHLTHDVLKTISDDPSVIQFPLSTSIQDSAIVAKFQKGVSSFIGMEEYPLYSCIRDPASSYSKGYFRKDAVSLWSTHGKNFVTANEYMDKMEIFQPDIFVALSDGFTDCASAAKRIEKSSNLTKNLFDVCIERHNSSPILKTKAIVAAIEGGYDLNARKRNAEFFATSPVHGFLIDGLYVDSKTTEFLDERKVLNVISETVKYLPPDKPRIVQGAWSPSMICRMIRCGIDVFDTCLPYLVTERNCALKFDFNLVISCGSGDNVNPGHYELEENETNDKIVNGSSRRKNGFIEDFKNGLTLSDESDRESIHSKQSTFVENLTKQLNQENGSKDTIFRKPYEICLLDERYYNDFGPIDGNCLCLTCAKHTKAYIHHLLVTRELLGPVLLMIHNIHYFLEFFRAIRRSMKSSL